LRFFLTVLFILSVDSGMAVVITILSVDSGMAVVVNAVPVLPQFLLDGFVLALAITIVILLVLPLQSSLLLLLRILFRRRHLSWVAVS
jgi:hypothetical protein